LGGVYKLVAVKQGTQWNSAIKISESPAKTPNPGRKQLLRLYDQRGKATADLLTLDDEDPAAEERLVLHHHSDHTKQRALRRDTVARFEPLLVEIQQAGKRVYTTPSLAELRQQRITDVEALDPGIRRLVNPHIYHVSLSQRLWDLKQELIAAALGENT
jgi:nicotinate phosphoribosyltransferase